MVKECPENEVINPSTGRCVSKTSKSLRFSGYYNGGVPLHEIVDKGTCPSGKVYNPATGKCVIVGGLAYYKAKLGSVMLPSVQIQNSKKVDFLQAQVDMLEHQLQNTLAKQHAFANKHATNSREVKILKNAHELLKQSYDATVDQLEECHRMLDQTRAVEAVHAELHNRALSRTPSLTPPTPTSLVKNHLQRNREIARLLVNQAVAKNTKYRADSPRTQRRRQVTQEYAAKERNAVQQSRPKRASKQPTYLKNYDLA
jgi:hypothetical protein